MEKKENKKDLIHEIFEQLKRYEEGCLPQTSAEGCCPHDGEPHDHYDYHHEKKKESTPEKQKRDEVKTKTEGKHGTQRR